MHSLICGLAVVQAMVLFLYLYRKCVVLERKRILARNVDWSLENQTFVSKFLHPSYVPYALSTFGTIAGLLLTGIFVRQEFFIWGYGGSLLVGMGIALVFHLPAGFAVKIRATDCMVSSISVGRRRRGLSQDAPFIRMIHYLPGIRILQS